MRKGVLEDGTPFFGVQIECFVSKTVFAKALTNHFWRRSQTIDSTLKKRDAFDILKVELFFNGIDGIDTSHWDGASEEFMRPFNDTYDAAIVWIEKHYPYLQ